jgi:hypothetical protein
MCVKRVCAVLHSIWPTAHITENSCVQGELYRRPIILVWKNSLHPPFLKIQLVQRSKHTPSRL